MKVKEEYKDKFVAAFYNLNRAIKNENDLCSEACGGLNEKELIVVGFVGQKQQVKMSEIAENIDAPMSTITSIVDKLVEKNLITREHSIDDRRAINVTLSRKGKTVFSTLIEKKKQTAEKILSTLDEKGQQLFIEHIFLLSSFVGIKK